MVGTPEEFWDELSDIVSYVSSERSAQSSRHPSPAPGGQHVEPSGLPSAGAVHGTPPPPHLAPTAPLPALAVAPSRHRTPADLSPAQRWRTILADMDEHLFLRILSVTKEIRDLIWSHIDDLSYYDALRHAFENYEVAHAKDAGLKLKAGQPKAKGPASVGVAEFFAKDLAKVEDRIRHLVFRPTTYLEIEAWLGMAVNPSNPPRLAHLDLRELKHVGSISAWS
jgi:hypothetical protein